MLISFSVTNFGPINERQTLSMESVSGSNKALQRNIIRSKSNRPDYLRAVAIYGPNAAGKSTLIKALSFLREFILTSHKQQIGEELDVAPFKLSETTSSMPSEFEIEFISQDIRYQYGVACTTQHVIEEWLFAYPEGRPRKWFHRVYDKTKKEYAYKYSPLFDVTKPARNYWEAETKNNELFLSVAIQRNNKQFLPVFEWFKNTLRVIKSVEQLSSDYTKKLCADNLQTTEVVNFLQHADLGISSVQIEKIPFHLSLPKHIPAELKKKIAEDFKDETRLEALFTHTFENTFMQLTEAEESDGTKAMFAFAGPWLDVQQNNRILVVDELDTSLHPLVVHRLVELFHHLGSQKNNAAQLIFTTHDATLLSQKSLRRDQVWFVEKNRAGATELYSLEDINDVRDEAAHEKAYLNGRYGGIPFMKELSTDGQ